MVVIEIIVEKENYIIFLIIQYHLFIKRFIIVFNEIQILILILIQNSIFLFHHYIVYLHQFHIMQYFHGIHGHLLQEDPRVAYQLQFYI